MDCRQNLQIGILLATYNGARYVQSQIRSLADNSTEFTLHWLDDHSTDATRDVVRRAARSAGIELLEWHQEQHQGLPGSYFRLLECAEADIYLFCDQDDIWQPGKVDATVGSLRANLSIPALSFTDLVMFRDGQPGTTRRPIDFTPDGKVERLLKDLRTFAFLPYASAQTQGFTRPLRDIFLLHSDTARAHALMHDWWMYDLALACGVVHMLPDAPGVLYRAHQDSFCARLKPREGNWLRRTWETNRLIRKLASKHAKGLIMTCEALPPAPKRDRVLELARILALLDQRQSPIAVMRLAFLGLGAAPSTALMALDCLCSDSRT